MPSFIELLEPTTPSFQTRTQDPQFSNQIDAAGNKQVFERQFKHWNSWLCLKFLLVSVSLTRPVQKWTIMMWGQV